MQTILQIAETPSSYAYSSLSLMKDILQTVSTYNLWHTSHSSTSPSPPQQDAIPFFFEHTPTPTGSLVIAQFLLSHLETDPTWLAFPQASTLLYKYRPDLISKHHLNIHAPLTGRWQDFKKPLEGLLGSILPISSLHTRQLLPVQQLQLFNSWMKAFETIGTFLDTTTIDLPTQDRRLQDATYRLQGADLKQCADVIRSFRYLTSLTVDQLVEYAKKESRMRRR